MIRQAPQVELWRLAGDNDSQAAVERITVGGTPRPTTGMSRPIMASDGMVRMVEVAVVARLPAQSLR